MARVARDYVVATHELVAEIAATFLGGSKANAPFDTARLREACNLMARMCSRLGLAGDYAITPSRGDTPMVGLSFACAADYERVVHLSRGDTPGPALNSFVLDETTHARLLEVAGPPDYDRVGRRSRMKDQALAAAFSERWN